MPDFSRPHRRFNPLLEEWVLVSPQRGRRPWLGQQEPAPPAAHPAYDPGCYLCPGNPREGGRRNPAYTGVWVFDNDFPALLPDAPAEVAGSADPLFRAEAESGCCRVICYSPRHDLTLPYLSAAAVAEVVAVWTEQYRDLAARPGIRSVTIFENRGAMMGASNPHPHGQIWANSRMPNILAREQAALAAYRQRHGSCLLCDTVRREAEAAERVVCENEGFLAVIPFWACWPFEILLLSKPHRGGLEELDPDARAQLAELLIRLGRGYDRLFETPFPTSWGFHLPPSDGAVHPECHLHGHFFPPLLRSASIRKFLVGYELLAMPQRDLTPETAAARLRAAMEPR
ncbi:MAG: UDP-glucose--hexose-1-phosphate uridylyltransferase [Terriglobales bacterium]